MTLQKLETVLSVQQLSLELDRPDGKVKLLENISFDLHKGQTLALIGASGSGKSLTSLAIMNLLPRNIQISGALKFKNHVDLRNCSDQEWQNIRGHKIAMIFQEPMSALNPIMSCGRQLQECILQHQSVSPGLAKSQAIHWLEKVQIPEPEVSYFKYPHEMSGGQKQRVMIAMAMCNHPELLIADEPTTALDVLVQQEVIQLMHKLAKENGTALIFITHDMALARTIADKVLVLEKGKISENQQLLKYNSDFKHSLYFSENEIVISIKNAFISYNKSTYAVSNFSYDFRQGSTVGIVGGSGCGKSTISKAILGLVSLDKGCILYKNQSVVDFNSSNLQLYRKAVQMIFQDPYASLNPRIRVDQMFYEILKVHKIVARKDADQYILSLLEKVGLDEAAMHKYPHEFSGGQRQRLCISRALALQPKVLVLDESVAALDIQMQQQIVLLLKQLQAELKLTYIFISHDMHIVHQMADEIIVMENGCIVETGTADQIMFTPKHSYTQKLIAAIP